MQKVRQDLKKRYGNPDLKIIELHKHFLPTLSIFSMFTEFILLDSFILPFPFNSGERKQNF